MFVQNKYTQVGAYSPSIRNVGVLVRGKLWLDNLSQMSQENADQEIIHSPLPNKAERHREHSTHTYRKNPKLTLENRIAASPKFLKTEQSVLSRLASSLICFRDLDVYTLIFPSSGLVAGT